ncbi:MAG: ATP-binding protein [Planctomycetota bacterium]|jgi:hypothetical protein
MRILRLRLENYRGIDACELRFAKQGVTVVEGPNEIGKSSLAEALDVLFDELDTTTKRSVKAIQPVDRDVGTLIEADVETGPYAFTYAKRFFKEKGTELKVTAPGPQDLRGREAHDRARAILQETIDEHLWRGLRVQQGSAIAQAEGLHKAPTLLRALDRSAGTTQAGERELGLFETVHEEYLRHFTEGGKERKELREAREEEEKAAVEVRRLSEDLIALERDVERSAQLEREVADLVQQAEEAKRSVAQRERELKELEARAGKVESLAMRHKAARAAESVARKDHRAREELRERANELRTRREELEARAAKETPALEQAEGRAQSARAELSESEREVRAADELFQLRDRDMKYHDGKLNLDLLRERSDRIEEARKRSARAKEFLDRTTLTDELLKRITESHLELERAQARLDAGSPRLAVEALADIEAEIDGETRTLSEGETVERTVAERTTVRLPDRVEVTVTAGTSVADLAGARDRLTRELASLLEKAGARELEEARTLGEERRQAERAVAESARTIEENLRDLTMEVLLEKVARLESWVEGYPAERAPTPALAPDFDSAGEAKTEARTGQEAAQLRVASARAAFDAAEEIAQELRREVSEAKVELRVAGEAEARGVRELEAARARSSDEDLKSALERSTAEAKSAEDAHTGERNALDKSNPVRVRELAASAERAAANVVTRLENSRKEQHEVAARLELRGERGLFEALEEARTHHRYRTRRRESLARQAAAARLLYETMRSELEEAQRSYVGPLRERIVELGKLVFDDSFSVELDEELAISTRTLHEKTLPFESLSVGAQEQLAIIARLACALTVDEAEGVPLILDDTLGHTDPSRLEGMGAMLRLAGERCQIIVLTCTPGRFRGVPATSLRLSNPLHGNGL